MTTLQTELSPPAGAADSSTAAPAWLDRLPAWAPLTATFLWLAATGWARPLALPDEGRYVGVAWAMLTSGDWVVPTLNGLPYFHKPPLFYWITAAALSVFGNAEWAARVAPLFGAGVGATALYLFARRWWNPSVAWHGLVIAATQPLIYVGAQFANLDMLVAGCIGATTLACAHVLLLAPSGKRPGGALAAAYLFAALGVLAKGLIGVALPGIVILAWLLVRRQARLLLALAWAPGIALFLAVAAPWFVAMQLKFPEFGHYFFVVQHFARYAQGGFNNQQPFWFFPVVITGLALPWSVWLLPGRQHPEPDPHRRSLRQFLWLWVALVTLFFSLPQSKLIGYILPVAWPLALLVAERIATAKPGLSRVRLLWRASIAGAVTACLGVVAVSATHPVRSSRELGLALASRMQPGDRVVFLQGFYFDVPFYARLRSPVLVVDDWRSPEIPRRDNWRKELADAARFAPSKASAVLLMPGDLPAAWCDGASTWVIGDRHLAARYPLLKSGDMAAVQGDTFMWRVAGSGVSAPCRGKPTASSAGKS